MHFKKLVLAYLGQWQQDTYEDIETKSDAKVFNSIASFISLVQQNLLELSQSHAFFTDLLSLSPEEKERAYQIYCLAHDSATLEEMEMDNHAKGNH